MVRGGLLAGIACVVVTAAAGDLLARFPFDECRGAASTNAVGGASAKLSPDVLWVRGQFGSAVSFERTGARVSLGQVSGLAGTSASSVSFWLRLNDADFAGTADVVRSGTNGVAVTLAGMRLGISAAGGRAEKVLEPNKWTLITFVQTKDVCTAYVGEDAVSTWAVRGPLVAGTVTLGGDGSFPGFIDDFAVYGRALSEDDVFDRASDAQHVEVESYQDDGAGGVQKTVLVGQDGVPCAK